MDAKFYVPYETARELRLKGYPQSTGTWYVEMARGVRIFKNQTNKEFEYIARPTYNEVLDWLEHTHHISVWASYIKQRWYGAVCRNDIRDADNTYPGDFYTSREEALNVAILETLKRL